MTQFPPPHDPKKLLIEIDARMKVRDIREWERLKQRVTVQWWESGLMALLFISGCVMVITVANVMDEYNFVLRAFIVGWSTLFILTLIGCIEFLVNKFRALRKMHEETVRHIEKVDDTLLALRNYLEARDSYLEEPESKNQE